jgi:HAD superfamily hydrolase (TIGR01509 family)
MVSAVIFDCDGVLVDSEPVANAVLAEVLTAEGLPTTPADSMRLYMGRSWASCMASVAEQLGRELDTEAIEARYVAGVRERWETELRPVPGIEEALDRITLPSCVASSGDHERMRFTLGHTGLLSRFEGRIFSATDPEVARGKPAPDLFLHAARSMGFDPATTAVVEDTVPGVTGARAAGMRVLGYAAHSRPEDLAAAGAEPFDDMRRLPELLSPNAS